MKLHLDYELIGKSNNAILFLHGWGLNKTYFDNCIKGIHDDYSKISLDFFGFGNSSYPDNYFDVYEYSYYVFLLVKKLKVNSVIIVGHSFGGRIAIILSSLFNLNIKCLILTSSAGINRFDLCKVIKIRMYKILKFLASKNIYPKKNLSKFGSDDYKKLDTRMQGVFIKTVKEDLKRWVSLIKYQTILVWDKKDKETPMYICKFLYKNIKNSKMILYNTGGHFTYLYNNNKFINVINDISTDNN